MMAGNAVEIVEKFTYLSSHLDNTGGSDAEVIRRIALTRDCMKALDRNIWRLALSIYLFIMISYTNFTKYKKYIYIIQNTFTLYSIQPTLYNIVI